MLGTRSRQRSVRNRGVLKREMEAVRAAGRHGILLFCSAGDPRRSVDWNKQVLRRSCKDKEGRKCEFSWRIYFSFLW